MKIDMGNNPFTKGFWILFIGKIFRTIISVKVLVIATIFVLATKLLIAGFITGAHWTTVVVSGVVAIVVMRGAFEISKLRENGNSRKTSLGD